VSTANIHAAQGIRWRRCNELPAFFGVHVDGKPYIPSMVFTLPGRVDRIYYKISDQNTILTADLKTGMISEKELLHENKNNKALWNSIPHSMRRDVMAGNA